MKILSAKLIKSKHTNSDKRYTNMNKQSKPTHDSNFKNNTSNITQTIFYLHVFVNDILSTEKHTQEIKTHGRACIQQDFKIIKEGHSYIFIYNSWWTSITVTNITILRCPDNMSDHMVKWCDIYMKCAKHTLQNVEHEPLRGLGDASPEKF